MVQRASCAARLSLCRDGDAVALRGRARAELRRFGMERGRLRGIVGGAWGGLNSVSTLLKSVFRRTS
jgi:hypothetical protein